MKSAPFTGQCGCGSVRFEVSDKPFAVHACHCSYCQRQTGATFAHNALIEPDAITLIAGEIQTIETPAPSGTPQRIVRCAKCRTPVWGHYGSFGDRASFIRVGALDNPGEFPPDVHIFTASKPDWLALEKDIPAFQGLYGRDDIVGLFGAERGRRWFRALLGSVPDEIAA